MICLMYFAHNFDTQNPDLIGVFQSLDLAQAAQSTLKLPLSWKGEILLVQINEGCFVRNETFFHPLAN